MSLAQLPNNYIQTASGLVVPPDHLRQTTSAASTDSDLARYSTWSAHGFSFGTRLERDPETLIIHWAPKGSGIDDKLAAAIADGTVANVGIAPVLFDQLSALLRRRQDLIRSASVVVTGKEYTTNRVTNALARFNDSPTGILDGISQILYQLDVYNRGAPIATIPITWPSATWPDQGMTLRPILDAKGKPSGRYYIDMDWRGRTPVPYLPSVFRLQPTNNAEWPYWYQTDVDGTRSWILLHNSQIIAILSGRSAQPGIGTSPLWICLPVLAEHALAIDERYEKLIDQPSEGLIGISGVTQSAEQLRTKIESEDHSWTLLAGPDKIHFDSYSFRQSDGVAWQTRQQHFEDVLAQAFHEHLSAVVIRGGIGYGVQGETAADTVAEGSVFAILQSIEVALGTIYPAVQIAVTKANDRARRLQLELLDAFAAAIHKLPDNTLTRDEIRALIDRDLITIPTTAPTIDQQDARPGAESTTEADAEAKTGVTATAVAELLGATRALLAAIIDNTPQAKLAAQLHRAITETKSLLTTMPADHWLSQLRLLSRHLTQQHQSSSRNNSSQRTA